MNTPKTIALYCAFLCLPVLISCNTKPKHDKTEIESAMQQYDKLLQKMDADSISKMFTPNGQLADIATGRDSIKRFLSSFENIQVLAVSSTTTSIELNNDTALQKGMYYQTAVMNQTDTAKLKGEYTTSWQWIPDEGWRIRKITTKPMQ